MLIRKNLEFSPRPSVRPFVRKYLEIRSLLFSETLQLVRDCKGGKNFPSAFLKKNLVSPILAKNFQNWPFLAKKMPKMEVFRIFLGIPKIEVFRFFLKKSEISFFHFFG